MRKIGDWMLLAMAAMSVFTKAGYSQDALVTSTGEPKGLISISIEMGRYDPAPGCKKDVDGCFPKVWTSTNTFTLGMRVWLKATLVNHTNLTAYVDVRPEIPPILFDLVENRNGSAPHLTSAGCRLRPDRCAPGQKDPSYGTIILSGLSNRWILLSGERQATIEEVTEQVVISEAGEYRIAADTGTFYLTTTDKLGPVGPPDKAFVKMSESAKAETVHFTMTK